MFKKIAIVIAAAIALSACNEHKPTSDTVQRRAQEQMNMQGTMAVGMPAIVNFSERRMVKDILEMRDKMLPTYTYLVNELNGNIGEKVCDSLGYGLPGAIQFTNPQKLENAYTPNGVWQGIHVIPQADPNGLFSPASMDGTWVMCKVPGTDKIAPQYIEPKVITLTFPKESRK